MIDILLLQPDDAKHTRGINQHSLHGDTFDDLGKWEYVLLEHLPCSHDVDTVQQLMQHAAMGASNSSVDVNCKEKK